MSTKDISRFVHQPQKHYAGVRLQQGRVVLDSDFNESAQLQEHDVQRALADLVGPRGSADFGFSIGQPFALDSRPDQSLPLRPGQTLLHELVTLGGQSSEAYNVTVRAGSMQLGGIRFEVARAESIAFQRDFLQMRLGDLPAVAVATGDFRHFYYLHAWEQCVSAVEDEELFEPMLRGPDTSVRLRRMRRVQVVPVAGNIQNCTAALDAVIADEVDRLGPATYDRATSELRSGGRLQLTFRGSRSADTCSPCIPGESRYLGAENATLRIMLTRSERFVWAINNGGPIFRVRVDGLDPTTPTEVRVTMLTPPNGERQLPLEGRVVEILPFGALIDAGNRPDSGENPHFRKLPAELGVFARALEGYDPDDHSFLLDLSVEIGGTLESVATKLKALVHQWDEDHPDADVLQAPPGTSRYFYMRLWHHAPTRADVELPLDRNRTLGDTGVIPVFHNAGRPADYWIASLRLETPDRIQPLELLTEPSGVPPHGPRRYFAPVAFLTGDSNVVVENEDCRKRIRRLTDKNCVTWIVGDGVTSIGDFTSIQDAIDALPSDGGRVAIRPGFYAQQVRIEGRRNVTLEGCGASTVIATPLRSPSGDLIEIRNCEGVALTGLTLHAAEQRAVMARRVNDLSLSGLAIIGGAFEGGAFSPTASTSTSSLVDLGQVASAELRSLAIECGVRPALLLVTCDLVRMRELTLTGLNRGVRPPAAPMVNISSSELVKFEDSSLKTFGQVGVALRGNLNHDVELSGLTIIADTFSTIRETRTLVGETSPRVIGRVEPQTTVDVEGGAAIRVSRGLLRMMGTTVSDHAVVVVHGLDVVVEDNHVESFSRSWGGIQVRGGSAGVEIRKNRILGGLGHGITLGSVLWRLGDSPRSPSPNSPNSPGSPRSPRRSSPRSPPRSPPKSPQRSLLRSPGRLYRREGAGAGQLIEHAQFSELTGTELRRVRIGRNLGQGIQDESGADLVPVNEGPIIDLVIADNRIQFMLGSGISVLTVLGLEPIGEGLIELERTRIEGNVIRNNLADPGDTIPNFSEVLPFPASRVGAGVAIPFLPYGGVVLSTATGGLDIRGNIISGNRSTTGSTRVIPVCGVFVLNGDAITISGNRIADNGDVPITPIPTASPPVRVRPLKPGVRAGIAVMLAGTGVANDLGEVSYFLEGKGQLDASGFSLRITNNTVRQPEGRALHAVATGPVLIERNFFSSRGNHGSDTLPDQFAIGDVVFVQNLGAPWEASNLGGVEFVTQDVFGRPVAPANLLGIPGFTPAPLALPPAPPPPVNQTLERQSVHQLHNLTFRYLLNQTRPRSPQFFVGIGGGLEFNGNQVTYDWELKKLPPLGRRAAASGDQSPPPGTRVTPLSFFPVGLFTTDHLGLNGNQFSFRIQNSTGQPNLTVPLGHNTLGDTNSEFRYVFREPLVANAFGIGATVQAIGNRCSEEILLLEPNPNITPGTLAGRAAASLLTMAELHNVTAFNQGTRLIYGLNSGYSFVNENRTNPSDNQVMFSGAANELEARLFMFKNFGLEMLRLLRASVVRGDLGLARQALLARRGL